MFGSIRSELSRPPRAVSRRPLGVDVVVELAAADDIVAARAVQGGSGLGLAVAEMMRLLYSSVGGIGGRRRHIRTFRD